MTVDQTQFRAALLDSALPAPEGLNDGHGHPAGARFSVYRNNVAVSLTEALEISFPAVRKLIGDENFKAVMGIFLRRHPPDTPMISQYGTALPGFLEGFAPLAHLAYLPDVARLEQALRESYHAADGTPLDPAILQGMPPDTLMTARLTLAPALRLVRSRWPIHGIWAYNMETGAPQPPGGAQDVLVTRPDFDPIQTPLPPGGGAFIAALLAAHSFAEAHEHATADTPTFDLTTTLGALIAGRAIHAITPGECP
ncbi:DNA-binding domain-containing protein [Rhodobacteraceae bacterium KMM 6894]|nr:DNA-binding domain-containing protein [Rhodobacteraceae bacterium KMM 6894]